MKGKTAHHSLRPHSHRLWLQTCPAGHCTGWQHQALPFLPPRAWLQWECFAQDNCASDLWGKEEFRGIFPLLKRKARLWCFYYLCTNVFISFFLCKMCALLLIWPLTLLHFFCIENVFFIHKEKKKKRNWTQTIKLFHLCHPFPLGWSLFCLLWRNTNVLSQNPHISSQGNPGELGKSF